MQSPNCHLDEKGCRKCATTINSEKARFTNTKFIEKAIEIHGNTYDYSKVDYKSTSEKVVIVCKEHGDFMQTPNGHLCGSGCQKCAGNFKASTSEFIEKAIAVHGDKYDYSKVIYKTVMGDKIIIICKEHGEFMQLPNTHLCGSGCFKCAHNMSIFSTEQFIEKATTLHGNKYDYSKSVYTFMMNKVNIICKEHGEFEQTVSNHITHKQGCAKCSNHYQPTTEEFIEKAIAVHGNTYDYSKVKYITNSHTIKIICKDHGEFVQTPATHLGGGGCQTCGRMKSTLKQTSSTGEFISRANIVHGEKYDYSTVDYKTARVYITIICKKHGGFQQIPDSHLRGSGCPTCKPKYSKMAIKYLNFMATLKQRHIQHAENGGEYVIPHTKFKADGYCTETNTVYEFHGTVFHGDPRYCKAEEYNHLGKNYGELYQKTIERETLIKDLGYNLVVMWERDWLRLNRAVSTIQKKFLNVNC